MTRNVKVSAIYSLPRYGPIRHWDCVVHAFCKAGIYPYQGTGVYWSQSLDKLLDVIVAEDQAEAVITCDFDSMFTMEDVQRLCDRFFRNPEIDALIPMQAKRSSDVFLGMAEENLGSVDGYRRARSGHFGMTIIGVDALKRMRKPWFHSKPDSNGGYWGEDKVDPDMWFWEEFNKSGNVAYFDETIYVGHIEECVAVLSEDGSRIERITMEQWYERFAPGRLQKERPIGKAEQKAKKITLPGWGVNERFIISPATTIHDSEGAKCTA